MPTSSSPPLPQEKNAHLAQELDAQRAQRMLEDLEKEMSAHGVTETLAPLGTEPRPHATGERVNLANPAQSRPIPPRLPSSPICTISPNLAPNLPPSILGHAEPTPDRQQSWDAARAGWCSAIKRAHDVMNDISDRARDSQKQTHGRIMSASGSIVYDGMVVRHSIVMYSSMQWYGKVWYAIVGMV